MYTKSQRPRSNYSEYNGYKSVLGRIENAIRENYRNNGALDLEKFRDQLDLKLSRKVVRSDTSTFLGFIDHYIEQQKHKPTANRDSWKKLETTFNHIKNFAKEHYNDQLDYNDINWEFRNAFLEWLYSPPRKHSINHAAKIIQITGQFMAEAERLGLHSNYEYKQRGFNVKKMKTKFPVLTFEDLEVLYKLDLSDNPKYDRVRDLFLIGAYSGLRVSDFTRLTPEHIINDQGVEMIHLLTKKTNTEVCIPLLPQLKNLLEKHDYHSPEPISNQRMNDYIKEICEIAELDRPVIKKHSTGGVEQEDHIPLYKAVSTHTARRSFATNFYEMGIPVSLLKAITGHSTEKQFFGYINTDKKKAARTMASMVADIMKGKYLES